MNKNDIYERKCFKLKMNIKRIIEGDYDKKSILLTANNIEKIVFFFDDYYCLEFFADHTYQIYLFTIKEKLVIPIVENFISGELSTEIIRRLEKQSEEFSMLYGVKSDET